MEVVATEPEAPAETCRGEILGRYEIEALLGRGGMGKVYRARDRSTDERVALKTLEAKHYKCP